VKYIQIQLDLSAKIYVGHRGRDRMVVGFTTSRAINAYHH